MAQTGVTRRDKILPTSLTLTVAPIAGDTSATLTANFLYVTGNFTVIFSTGETRTVTLTSGAKTATWTGGLQYPTQTTILVLGAHDGAQSSSTALVANQNREFVQIQNQDTSPLFVYFGSGATTSVYHFVLKGGTGAADGTGGSFSTSSVVYRGIITVASAGTPSYSLIEL